MKFLNMDRVLCISPHSDDTEFGMAGTILKNRDTEFHIVVFSGRPVSNGPSDEDRWEEVRGHWNGIDNVQLYFLEEKLFNLREEEWVLNVEKLSSLNTFDAVFLPSLTDTHYEHRAVHHIAMAITRSTPLSILEYRSPSTYDTWVPNVIVSFSKDILLEKVRRMANFRSQSGSYFDVNYLNAFHSWPSAIKKGIDFCEQFRAVTIYE